MRTHQALLALLGAAAQTGRRRDILRGLLHAVTRTGTYRHSAEELTPARWTGAGADPVTAFPVAAAALATLIRPAAWRHFAVGATSAYSLTPEAWRRLLDTAAAAAWTPPDDGNGVAGGVIWEASSYVVPFLARLAVSGVETLEMLGKLGAIAS